jgi:hypothetical protein
LAGVRSVRARLGKQRVRVVGVKRVKHSTRITVATRGLHRGTLRFRVKLASGKTVTRSRSFRGCG